MATQKLYIAKNKYGRYYSVIKNEYSHCNKIISVNLPKNTELQEDYGTFECEYYLSCYKSKTSDETYFCINVTKIYAPTKNIENPYDIYNQDTPIETPF